MDMDAAVSILLILGALLTGAISPGPSFVLVANTTLSVSRIHGITASLGMGVGGVILSLLALTGLHAMLANTPAIYLALKILGGLYLGYLAIRIWQGAKDSLSMVPHHSTRQRTLKRTFLISLLTQLSNPKAAVLYASIFAALLPETIHQSFFFILPPLVFIVETGWYLVVTLVLSTSTSRVAYLSSKIVYDRVAATIMGVLSLKLLTSVTDP